MCRKTLIAILAVIAPFVCCAGVLLAVRYFTLSDVGPPRESEVRRIQAILEALSGPEAVQEKEGIDSKRFANSEWVVGIGIDGHSRRQARDTVVVKDSRGSVRAFVGGHVCGPGWLGHTDFLRAESLDQFYERLAKGGFVEYHPPKEE